MDKLMLTTFWKYFRFKIIDLPGAEYLRVSLKFMVCMENGLPCEEEVSVLDDTLIPKPSCDWKIGTEIKSKQEKISFSDLMIF